MFVTHTAKPAHFAVGIAMSSAVDACVSMEPASGDRDKLITVRAVTDWVGLPTNACTAFLKASGIEGGASPRVLAVSSVDKLDKLIGCLQ